MALLALFDKFVQLLTDERREVEVVLLDPLGLVLSDGDILPSHDMHTIRTDTHKIWHCVGLWACNRTVYEQMMTALYPRPTPSLHSGVEDGGLAPVFS